MEMIGILTAFAGKASEYLVAPIGRRLGYLFCYRSHTDELRSKVQELTEKRDDLQITVEEARRRGEEIRPIVEGWLNRVDGVTEEAEKLMKDEKKKICCMNGWCPNLKSRYLLAREAAKKAKVIVEIQAAYDFPQGVAHRPPMRTVTFKDYESYESRASTLNKILDALKDDKMKIIGVWGMGGVGKTTLLKQVAEQAKQQQLFNTRVYVDVSWTREFSKFEEGISSIQQHIAEKLDLKLEEKTIPARADKLMERLKKEKIFIVLDDIWNEVDLNEVGIPCKDGDQKDCKIVLASRDENLLRRMDAKKLCPLQHLEEEEARLLFKKTVGASLYDDPQLQPVAHQIVKECMGLPIAIVTVAKTLLHKKRVDAWKDTLDELISPTNNEEEDPVYKCLAFSYNLLKNDGLKSLFLLCGFLNYGDISMHHLLIHAVGLDLFDRLELLAPARNKLVNLVSDLKASSLLLDGEGDGGETSRLLFMDADGNKTVRMHDVVRDVARKIAFKDPHHRFKVIEDVPSDQDWLETDQNSKFISLNCEAVHELPHRLLCPKLQFFLLENASPSLNVPNTFFEGMKLLKVLDLSGMDFETLPSTLQSLASLRTLRLDRCKNLRDVAEIGELKKLQVLSMAGSAIRQLPQPMAQLTNLRLLNLNNCKELEVIPRNILSKLSRLECLFMKSSFSKWAVEEVSDGESNIACLSELNDLDHLRTIEVEIPGMEMIPEEDKFFHNLTSFAIFIGNFDWWEKIYERSKTLKVKGSGDHSLLLRNGMRQLFEKTEELLLSELKGGMEDEGKGAVSIPSEDGVLFGEKIWSHNQLSPHSFSNLRILNVSNCQCLVNLIPGHLMRSLNNLKEMLVKDCEVLEHVFDIQLEGYDVDTNVEILLPKLETLNLVNLSGLKGIFRKNDSIREIVSLAWMPVSFPNLKCLSIHNCGEEVKYHEDADISIHDKVLFGEKASFPNLEEVALIGLSKLKKIWSHNQLSPHSFSNLRILNVSNCPCLVNLIPGHLMRSLNNLKEMEVWECKVLEYVFDIQLEGYDVDTNVEILPKLETLSLYDLSGLKGIFCKNDSIRETVSLAWMPVSFPNLKCLSIWNCGNEVKYQKNADGAFFGEKVSFPNLEALNLSGFSMLKMIWYPQQQMLKRFQNLKSIVVCDCQLLNHLFDHKGILPKIEILKLEELPNLRHIFYNGDKNDNMRYLLSLSKFKILENIKELRMVNCGKPLDEEGSFSSNLEVLVLKGFFKLKEIKFENPQNLRILALKKLPKLSRIIWHEGENDNKIFHLSPSEFKNFHGLKGLIIDDCGMEDRRDVLTPANALLISNEEVPLISDGGVCNYETFKSRAFTFNKIMEVLRDDNIKSIGVVGVRGVGKTTLIKQVAHQAMLEKLFTKQVYVDLSWTRHFDELEPEISRIQEKVAEMSGLEFLSHWNESERAVEMRKKLKNERMLIILDDLWKEFNLEKIGIPSRRAVEMNECKIVLTCRDGEGDVDGEQLCKDMGAQTCFRVKILLPEEAWSLFKKIALTCDCDKLVVEDEDTNNKNNIKDQLLSSSSIAKQVVEECCEGLPIAVAAIARALKDETQWAVWESALGQLIKNCAARGNKAYSCLEWCYTHLKPHDLKSFLFICGMLNSYGDISMHHLLQYAIGLDLFGCIDSLDQARNKLLEFLEILKASGWLIEMDHHHHGRDNLVMIRMHDVVREIVSKDPRAFALKEDVVGDLEEWSKSDESKSCTFISLQYSKVVHELLRHVLVCPKLQCFLLHNEKPSLDISIPNTFFQGMKKLQVLDLSRSGFATLPSSLDSLVNLLTLRLDECKNLVDIAGIGKMKKLQVLSLGSSAIQQLPDEMKQLINLRLLDLDCCRELKEIPPNILSNLSKLECLSMTQSFTEWAMEGDHQSINVNNACLSELSHLSCLTTLDIEIPDVKLLPNDIQFDNLTRYAISIGGNLRCSRRAYRTLKLEKVNISLDSGDGILKLLERSEELEFKHLIGNNYVLQYPSNEESFAELKHLEVTIGDEILYIIDSMDQLVFLRHGAAFPLLESLVLVWLLNLRELWHGCPIPRGSFGNLKTLEVSWCHKLRYLFYLSTARDLSQLEHMTIEWCDSMQQIIACEKESEDEYGVTNLELFPNLRTLKLGNLTKLINFMPELDTNARHEHSSFNHKHGATFPLLDSLVLFPISRGSFRNLKSLEVESCDKLRYLCYLSTARGLSQLEHMTIKYCHSMQQIIACEKESEDEYGLTNLELFPNLRTLKLEQLRELINFMPELDTNERPEHSSFNHKVLFSKLEELELIFVPKLKDVWNPQSSFGSISNLRNIRVHPNTYGFFFSSSS